MEHFCTMEVVEPHGRSVLSFETSVFLFLKKTAVLEVGCGAGNTVFPLLERLKGATLTVYCCDFSPNAVNLVRGNKDFEPARCESYPVSLTSFMTLRENPIS